MMVKRSTFADTARDFRKRVAQAKHCLLGEGARASGDTNSDSFVAVQHDAIVWLDEEIGNSARNVREEADRIASNGQRKFSPLMSGQVNGRDSLTHPITSALPSTR